MSENRKLATHVLNLSYDGITGVAYYRPDDELWSGKLMNIDGDLVTFEACHIDVLIGEFEIAVRDWRETRADID